MCLKCISAGGNKAMLLWSFDLVLLESGLFSDRASFDLFVQVGVGDTGELSIKVFGVRVCSADCLA